MRAIRLLLITTLTSGALLVLAPAAGAASTTQACNSLQTLSDDLSDVGTTSNPKNFSDVQDQYNDIGDAFSKAARTAPRQVRSSLRTLGSIYNAIADGDVGDLQNLGSKKYTKALKKYSTYVATACS